MKRRRFVLLLVVIVFAMAAAGTALADEDEERIEVEFEFVLDRGPDGAKIKANDDTVIFDEPGDYVLQFVMDDGENLGMVDDLLEIRIQGDHDKVKVGFDIEMESGPDDAEIEVDDEDIAFSTVGDYVLRLIPASVRDEDGKKIRDAVEMVDDRIEVAVQTDADFEREFEAMAASVPATELESDAAQLGRVYLPMIVGGDGAAGADIHPGHDAVPADLDAPAGSVIDFGPFDKNRIPIELQAWWTPAFGHVHVAVLVPLGQTVQGTLDIPVRIVMHENPSVLKQLRIDSDRGVEMKVSLGNLTCEVEICAWALTVKLDTSKLTNGWRELRFRAETETPDGKKFLNSSGIQVNVQNGGGKGKNYSRFCDNTSLIGRGWYDGFGYSNAVVECVPTAPVSGTVTFRVKAQKASKHLTVDLDKAHFIPAVGSWAEQPTSAGQTLFSKDGKNSKWVNIEIDTTTLDNGWHSLAVRSDGPKGEVSKCSGCPDEKSFPAGVAKFWFYVQN